MKEQFFNPAADGNDAWSLEQGATVFNNSCGVPTLELFAAAGGPIARAVSAPVAVKAGVTYRLTHNIQGVEGFGDASTTHYFRVYPIDNNGEQIFSLQGQRFAGTPNFLDCMSFNHIKTFCFKVPAKHDAVRFVLEAQGPSKVHLDNFKIEVAVEKKQHGAILLDMPFNYRDGVFHSNPAKKITGKVAIYSPKAAKYTLTLTDGKNQIMHRESPAKGGSKKFTLPVPDPGKNFKLTLKLFNENGKEIFKELKKIHFHKPNPVEVSFRDDGITLVNGKPFFQIGSWWFTNRGDWDEDIEFLKEAGFNLFLLPRDNPDFFPLLEVAEKHDILSVIELPDTFKGHTAEEKRAERKRWTDLLKKYKQHPCLFGFFAPDEAMWRGVQIDLAEEVYRTFRKLDPYHPVWYNESPCGTVEAKREYADKICDVFGVDIYPIGAPHGDMKEDRTITCVGKHTDRSMQVTAGRKPVWMILQGFAWKHFLPQNRNLPADQVPDVEYPTWEESRFMAFNAILHGASGIQYHWLGYTLHVPDEFWCALRKVTLELSYLSPVLTARTVEKHTVTCDSAKIKFMVKEIDGKRYYLAANESPETVQCVFSGIPEASLNVILETEPVSVTGGTAVMEFAPYAVKVFSAEKFDAQEKIFKADSYRPYSAPIKDDVRYK